MEVKCPRCGRPAAFDTTNPARPFCGERCQTLDLGAWADEQYRVPERDDSSVNENTEDDLDASETRPPKHRLN